MRVETSIEKISRGKKKLFPEIAWYHISSARFPFRIGRRLNGRLEKRVWGGGGGGWFEMWGIPTASVPDTFFIRTGDGPFKDFHHGMGGGF